MVVKKRKELSTTQRLKETERKSFQFGEQGKKPFQLQLIQKRQKSQNPRKPWMTVMKKKLYHFSQEKNIRQDHAFVEMTFIGYTNVKNLGQH